MVSPNERHRAVDAITVSATMMVEAWRQGDLTPSELDARMVYLSKEVDRLKKIDDELRKPLSPLRPLIAA